MTKPVKIEGGFGLRQWGEGPRRNTNLSAAYDNNLQNMTYPETLAGMVLEAQYRSWIVGSDAPTSIYLPNKEKWDFKNKFDELAARWALGVTDQDENMTISDVLAIKGDNYAK